MKLMIFCFLVLMASVAQGHHTYFFSNMSDERNIPYSGRQLSRLEMVREVGTRFPTMDCSFQCSNSSPYKLDACRLGLFGATYLLTGYQELTGRSNIEIWRTPNTGLTVAPYAFMKERERGVSCENSYYVQRFPTRESRPGERRVPIRHIDVCRAWNAYFDAADGLNLNPGPRPQQSDHDYDERRRPWHRTHRQVKRVQRILWDAHTKAALHSYWQYTDLLSWGNPQQPRSPESQVPVQEYRSWMAWNRIVATTIPQRNSISCVEGTEFLVRSLMPNCILGTRGADGRACQRTKPRHLGVDALIGAKAFNFLRVLSSGSLDLQTAIDEFVRTVGN